MTTILVIVAGTSWIGGKSLRLTLSEAVVAASAREHGDDATCRGQNFLYFLSFRHWQFARTLSRMALAVLQEWVYFHRHGFMRSL